MFILANFFLKNQFIHILIPLDPSRDEYLIGIKVLKVGVKVSFGVKVVWVSFGVIVGVTGCIINSNLEHRESSLEHL